MRHTGVGQRNGTDLLVVSLSTTDAIGHAYGPDSREQHDQLLRLDHWLGWFLDSLALLVPRERTIFALTADHGVQPFPEMTGKGGRVSFQPLAMRFAQEYQSRYRIPIDVTWDLGLITADLTALKARGVNVDSLAEAMAREARSMAGVARVFTPRSLARAPAGDEEARLWRRAIPPSRDWLIAASSKPGWIWADTPGWTNHGSTQPLDMHVPIMFLGAGASTAADHPQGDHRGHRPDLRCAGRRAAHRSRHGPRPARRLRRAGHERLSLAALLSLPARLGLLRIRRHRERAGSGGDHQRAW